MTAQITITLSKTRTEYARNRARACGRVYRYEKHIDVPHFAVLVACQCPGGHGVANLPWRGYFTREDADMTLADPTADRLAARRPAVTSQPASARSRNTA